nr:LysE/ArgO family amino acid transporter [uncultured Desulfobulbus sp.]
MLSTPAELAIIGQGFATGMGLIVVIGAQNSFVLSQGIRRNHHLLIAVICSACDALLISAGIGGMGGIVARAPRIGGWLSLIGALFLVSYGLLALRSACASVQLTGEERPLLSRRAAIATTLSLTLLNPHVYLDTLVLMGALASGYQGMGRALFAAGAMGASLFWFFSLSLGGRMLAPLFSRPLSWKILDTLVCITMWGVAWSLLKPLL